MKKLTWAWALLALWAFATLGIWFMPVHPVEAQLAAANGFTYAHISTATSTVVKGAPGILHTVTLNGGTFGGVTIYDNATACSGTVIATIATVTAPLSLHYDLQAQNGVCVTTAAATDVTVTVR